MGAMQNVILLIEGGILTIKIDLEHLGGLSKTGKTHVVGTTSGPKPLAGYPEFSVNCTVYRKDLVRKAQEEMLAEVEEAVDKHVTNTTKKRARK